MIVLMGKPCGRINCRCSLNAMTGRKGEGRQWDEEPRREEEGDEWMSWDNKVVAIGLYSWARLR